MATFDENSLVADIEESDCGRRVKIMGNDELRERGFAEGDMPDEVFGSEEFGELVSEEVENGTVMVSVDEKYRDHTHATDDGLRELDVRMIQFVEETEKGEEG